jgi:hypothetical protein
VKRGLSFLALTAAFALATRLGWWAVPAAAMLWGALRPRIESPAGTAALAAAVAWGGWLLAGWLAYPTEFAALTARLGGVMNLPVPVLILLTLLLAALLAWSAAALAGTLTLSLVRRFGGSS